MLDLGLRLGKTPRDNRSQILHIKERNRGKVTDNVPIRVDEKEVRLLYPLVKNSFIPSINRYQEPFSAAALPYIPPSKSNASLSSWSSWTLRHLLLVL